VNVQIAVRGSTDDYDRWAAEGCSGWSSGDVLRSFVRLEADADFPTAEYHGDAGPVPIERPEPDATGPVDLGLFTAASALGYGWCPDHNAPGATGVSPVAHNSRGGVRFSTNDAYLEPMRAAANLRIVGDARVDRVMLDGARAIGVTADTAQGQREFFGSEVILSAGAVYSPAILMRSGVGPADHLRELGITVVADLPVGRGLNDHAAIDLELLLKERGPREQDTYGLSCLVRGSSPDSDLGPNDIGFGSFNYVDVDADGRSSGSIFFTLFRAFSRGTVCLRSRDPGVEPEIDLNMLADERDLERMRFGAARLFEIAAHPAISSIAEDAHVAGVRSRGDLPRDLDRWLLERCDTIGHPCSTARMGAASDERTVVDADCRVMGIEGLRVADASVMPSAPSGPNHLSCVMLGEHLAQRMLSARC
jgi:choline dehydrogenase